MQSLVKWTSVAATLGWFALGRASAQIIGGPTIPGPFQDLPSTISTIVRFLIYIAGIFFVILFLVGGIQYLSAAGNEEATGKAKRLLIDSVVGLIITLAAWAIANFILRQFGVTLNLFTI